MPSCRRSSQAHRRTSNKPWRASAAAPAAVEHARPVDDDEFAARIGALGRCERQPRLAVAVSGGPDSLALCLLADRWARARGGAVVGLIVDHDLRLEAADEARRTAAWLAARGIDHRILTWRGAKPATGLQAAARAARYRLLAGACRGLGRLHLLLAHHQEDQAETVVMRAARGSGPDGLAGMAAVREIEGCRLLRPLLGIPKARLGATLIEAGQPWLEDPSNRARAFARGRLRLDVELDAPRLAKRAAERGHRRAALDRRVADWLVAAARIDPAGYALLSAEALAAASPEVRRRAVQQILTTIGGNPYPPRRTRLDPLVEQLQLGLSSGRTLAGCRILRWRGSILVCREPGAIDHVAPLAAGASLLWDRRFWIEAQGQVAGLAVRALGDVRPSRSLPSPPRRTSQPAPVRPALPAIWRGERLLAVPSLGLVDPAFAEHVAVAVRFRPAAPIAGAPFGGDTPGESHKEKW